MTELKVTHRHEILAYRINENLCKSYIKLFMKICVNPISNFFRVEYKIVVADAKNVITYT